MSNVLDTLEAKGKALGFRNNIALSLTKAVSLMRKAEEQKSAAVWYRAAEEFGILFKLAYDAEECTQTRVWGGSSEPTKEDEAAVSDIREFVVLLGEAKTYIDEQYEETKG